MKTFGSISQAVDGLLEFRFTKLSGLPEELQTRFKEALSATSVVTQIAVTGEILYANKDLLDQDGKSLTGGVIAFATERAWNGLLIDDRGGRIVMAMHRELGEKPIPGFKPQKEEMDPPPLDGFKLEAPADQAE